MWTNEIDERNLSDDKTSNLIIWIYVPIVVVNKIEITVVIIIIVDN